MFDVVAEVFLLRWRWLLAGALALTVISLYLISQNHEQKTEVAVAAGPVALPLAPPVVAVSAPVSKPVVEAKPVAKQVVAKKIAKHKKIAKLKKSRTEHKTQALAALREEEPKKIETKKLLPTGADADEASAPTPAAKDAQNKRWVSGISGATANVNIANHMRRKNKNCTMETCRAEDGVSVVGVVVDTRNNAPIPEKRKMEGDLEQGDGYNTPAMYVK